MIKSPNPLFDLILGKVGPNAKVTLIERKRELLFRTAPAWATPSPFLEEEPFLVLGGAPRLSSLLVGLCNRDSQGLQEQLSLCLVNVSALSVTAWHYGYNFVRCKL